MNYLDNYKNHENNTDTDTDIEILFNKKYNCLKINEMFYFIDKNKACLESELPLNEGWFDFEWSELLPKTTSDWIHFSVDTISAVLDIIPGGQPISAVIDIIHGLSYFVEAEHDPKNKTNLYICGAITLAFVSIPGFGNPVSALIKRLLKTGKPILTNVVKILPANIVLRLFRSLLNFGKVGKKVNGTLAKHSNDVWMKTLKKIPAVEKILKVAPKKLDELAKELPKIIKQDIKKGINVMSELVIKNTKKSYKSLPRNVRKYIPEKEYEAILRKNMDDVLPSINNINKNPSKYLKEFDIKNAGKYEKQLVKKIQTSAERSIGLAEDAFKVAHTNKITRFFYRKSFTNKAKKQIVKDLKSGEKFNYDIFINDLIKKTPTNVIARFAKQGVKKGIPMLLKNRINDYLRDETDSITNSDNTNTSSNTTIEPIKTDNGIVQKKSFARENGGDPELMSKYNLKDSHVDNVSEMGESKIVFQSPNKKGEDGELYLDGGIYSIFDFSNDMNLYDNEKELFGDLVKIGKKKAGKKRKSVRKGEMEKWEKSPRISTPYIKELDNQRYEFDFLVRERSKISLATKKDTVMVNWTDVFNSDDFKENKFYKVNNSLYITFENIITDNE